MKRLLALALLIGTGLGSAVALAQHKGSGSGAGSGSGSAAGKPYAGLDLRSVASFSDEDVATMRAGRGMGFALPAETNGYPGPMHILELAAELDLSAAQRSAIDALFQRMQSRARLAGDEYVKAEMALDAAFKAKTADTATIARLTREADQRRSEKRLSHLEAHIVARRILNEAQLKRYAILRGYEIK